MLLLKGTEVSTGTKTRRFSNFVRLRTSSSKTLRFDPISIVIFEKQAYIPAYTRSPSSWNGLLTYSQGIFLTTKVFFLQPRYFSYSQGNFLKAKVFFLYRRYFSFHCTFTSLGHFVSLTAAGPRRSHRSRTEGWPVISHSCDWDMPSSSITKPPLLQRSRLTGGGSPNLVGLVERKAL